MSDGCAMRATTILLPSDKKHVEKMEFIPPNPEIKVKGQSKDEVQVIDTVVGNNLNYD